MQLAAVAPGLLPINGVHFLGGADHQYQNPAVGGLESSQVGPEDDLFVTGQLLLDTHLGFSTLSHDRGGEREDERGRNEGGGGAFLGDGHECSFGPASF